MRPVDAFEELASIVVGVVKRPYRAEHITPEEWDSITDRILLLAKGEKHGDARGQEAERSTANADTFWG